MKAKVIATGKIADVEFVGIIKRGGVEMDQYKMIDVPYFFVSSELDFNDTIDWEQRRYEISKEMLPCIQRINSKVAFRTGKICSDKEIVETAIRFADELITQLKGE